MKTLKKIGLVLCLIEVAISIAAIAIGDGSSGLIASAIIFLLLAGLLYKSLKKHPKEKQSNTVSTYNKSADSSIERSTMASNIEDGLTPRQKKDLTKAIATEKLSLNPKFHRTEREEELAFQFFYKWGEKLSTMEEAFENAYRDAYYIDDPEKKIEKYYEALELFHKAKNFCYSKSKGGQIHFQDMWESMHNSQNALYSYEDLIRQSIKDTQDLYYRKIPAIISEIQKGNGNLLQKDIYNHIPDIPQSEIQSIIRRLEEKGGVLRTKKGSTYLLSLPTHSDNKSKQSIDTADEIRKYKALLDDGIITEEEFAAKKKELLSP